ncbi:helicase-associated domain-containing protein [Dactylosporangium sp. CA-092794]|uniref:helicase-associated domain-containing protein n=1 Tax=Dactylosporangium sp. CA-092794 TaxID=3239929 RepID=UPI003D9355D2
MPDDDQVLLHWLESLPEEALARLLAARPESLEPPWPRHLRALAERIGEPEAVTMTVRRLPTPAVQVLRALAALPVGATRETLASFLGLAQDDPDLAQTLATLAEYGLAWADEGDQLRQPRRAAAGWQHPLNLGRPLAAFLENLNLGRVKELARTHNLSLHGGKHALTERLTAYLSSHDRVAGIVATGPTGIEDLLRPFVWDQPIGAALGIRSFAPPDGPATPVRWAADRGLLWHQDWDFAEMPREVALALRGRDYHPPFDPRPPAVATVAADPEAVDQAASVAAGHLFDRACALLDLAARTPLATVKTGGVGSREIKRVAKLLCCAEDEIRVLLEVAFDAGLIGELEGAVRATPACAGWMEGDPAQRYATLARAWWTSPRSALWVPEGPRPAALADTVSGEAGVAVRRALLAALSRLPAGSGVDTAELAGGPGGMDPVGETGGIAGYVRWLCPAYPTDLVDGWISSAAAEAQLLGAVAGGAVSTLGRALVEDGDVVTTARGLLTVTCRTALLGADLTAVVAGPPSAELARVLDRLADRESRGTASIWRFSPATVRSAFDEGFTEERILADLAAIAAGGLPQPLEYLVKDVARRHGEVGVTGVVCVIRGLDEPLLAELLAHRKLAKLGLHPLAPTVLASGLPPDQTLALLREAGYAPVPTGLDGVSTIRRADQSRAGGAARAEDAGQNPAKSAAPRPAEAGTAVAALDPRVLAERLRATPVPVRMSEAETWEVIARHTGHQRGAALSGLQYFATYGVPVRVQERLEDGTETWWELRSVEIVEDVLIGWCPELQDYRQVRLDSIALVRQHWS